MTESEYESFQQKRKERYLTKERKSRTSWSNKRFLFFWILKLVIGIDRAPSVPLLPENVSLYFTGKASDDRIRIPRWSSEVLYLIYTCTVNIKVLIKMVVFVQKSRTELTASWTLELLFDFSSSVENSCLTFYCWKFEWRSPYKRITSKLNSIFRPLLRTKESICPPTLAPGPSFQNSIFLFGVTRTAALLIWSLVKLQLLPKKNSFVPAHFGALILFNNGIPRKVGYTLICVEKSNRMV